MSPRLIILAAGNGTRLRPLTDDRPKALVPLLHKPLLEWQLAAAAAIGLNEITIVGGYRFDQLAGYADDVVVNERFDRTNMVYSVYCARSRFSDHVVLSYGDIIYRPQILDQLIESQAPVSVVVDRDWRSYWERRFDDPLSDAESLCIDAAGDLESIGQKPGAISEIQGQYIGLLAFRGDGISVLTAHLDAMFHDDAEPSPVHARMFMTDFLQSLIDRGHKVRPVLVNGGWLEVDSVSDLRLAEQMLKEGRLGETRAWSFG